MATKYGTAKEILDTRKELDGLRSIESDPYRFGSIQDKGEFRKRKKSLEDRLRSITPPAVSSNEDRKRLMQRSDQLEQFIKGRVSEPGMNKPEMPSKFDQWENPAGAVGRHRNWEDKIKNFTIDAKGNVVRAKGGYGAQSEWKDIQSQIHPLEEQLMDPDIRSVEKLRSQNASGRSLIDRRSMNFAQGAAVTQEQWDEAMSEPEPLKAKIRKEVPAELQCIEIKANGEKCTGKKMRGKDYCLGHSRKHAKAEVITA